MPVIIHAATETNGKGYLVWAADFPGAYARGITQDEALGKLPADIRTYHLWAYGAPMDDVEVCISQQYTTALDVDDADSDILLDGERAPMTQAEYSALKSFAIKSAHSFQALFDSIPDKACPLCPARKTFYGDMPALAQTMYAHVNNVAAYYAGEVGARHQNIPGIAENRAAALACVEALPEYLTAGVRKGSYDEYWSLRKVLRRFIWHDRIHARAMQRHASALWGADQLTDAYFFHRGGLI